MSWTRMSWRTAAIALLLIPTSLLGCEKKQQIKKDADAGVQAPVADKHIADAVASAAASGGPGGAAEDGPPPNGVFAVGEADKQQPANAPLKATIISSGSDPKVKMMPVRGIAGVQRSDLTVVYMEGRAPRAARFTLDVSIPEAAQEGDGAAPAGSAKPAAPAASAKPAGSAAVATPAGAPITKPTPIQFVIVGVGAHQELPLTKEELDKLATLKGTRVSAVIGPNGGLTGETFELSKKADKTKTPAVKSLVDTVSLFFSPWPKEPVGLGAYWIASDRATMGGLDLVRYRVTKIEEMKGDNMVLSLDLRLYAASPSVLPAGAPPSGVALKFQGQGKGAMNRKQGVLLPVEGQVQAPIVLQYAASADAQMAQVYQQQYAAIWTPFQPAKKDDKKP